MCCVRGAYVAVVNGAGLPIRDGEVVLVEVRLGKDLWEDHVPDATADQRGRHVALSGHEPDERDICSEVSVGWHRWHTHRNTAKALQTSALPGMTRALSTSDVARSTSITSCQLIDEALAGKSTHLL